jgi:aminoglycoside/choline kinase family phosphotransferase
VVVLPDLEDPHGLSEAGSFFHIGRHLFACGAPVPEMFAFCPETGAVVCEDCGRELLFDRVRAEGFRFSAGVRGLYRRVAAGLARMQVRAARGFDPAWCWQDAAHDREAMLARESFYFLD